MINPTWQDKERRIVYVSNKYVNLDNPLSYASKDDHGELVKWTEKCVTVKLDGFVSLIDCQRHNLFWEDNEPDFDELRSLHSAK